MYIYIYMCMCVYIWMDGRMDGWIDRQIDSHANMNQKYTGAGACQYYRNNTSIQVNFHQLHVATIQHSDYCICLYTDIVYGEIPETGIMYIVKTIYVVPSLFQ